MKNLLAVLCVSVCALAIFPGCGGDGGGKCGNSAPCGGSVVGTWNITSSCATFEAAMFDPDCPSATTKGVDFEITGTITYNADLTYTVTGTVSGSVEVTLPAACLARAGMPGLCAQLQQELETDPDFISAACRAAGGGCVCTVGLPPETMTESGVYATTAAGLLTETPAGETPQENDYCVKGTTMTVSPHAGVGMMGEPMVSGTITLTRK